MVPETELDKTFKKIDYVYRWSGVNLESSKKTPRENFNTTCWFFFNFVWVASECCGCVGWLVKNSRNGATFTELTYVVPIIIYMVLVLSKSILFFVYDEQVNEVMLILRASENNFSRDKDEIVAKETSFVNSVLTVLNYYNWCSMTLFPLMPLLYMALKYQKSGEVELMLPILAKYPFDQFDIRYWPFVYLKQLWCNVAGLFLLVGVDFFFYVSTSYTRLQFKLLQYDIERVITGHSRGNLNHDAEFDSRFAQLIRRHQELFHCVDLIETIYSKSTLQHVISSSMLICICGFNILTIDDVPYIISFVCFLCVSVYQICFLCLFGDLLMTSTMEVSDGVYLSKWYQANPSAGKQLHILQIRARRACKLTAFGFADVNLAAFAKILSRSWSYFALLQRLYTSRRG